MTCSTFRDPSLELLWQNIDSLTPLLQLLPSEAVVQEGDYWALGRPLVKQDWISFKRYAKYVRDLSLTCAAFDYDNTNDTGCDFDLPPIPSQFPPDFFTSFHQSFDSSNPGAALLPSLTTFAFSVNSASDFACCSMIMASSLRRISLGYDWYWNQFYKESGLESFFDSIACSPSRHSVQALYLPLDMNMQKHPHLRNPYLHMLSSLQALQRVGLSSHLFSDSDGMRCLAEKSDLKHIEVGYHAFTEPKHDPFGHGPAFPKLCSLEVGIRCLRYILPVAGRGAITSIKTWYANDIDLGETAFHGFCQTISLIAQRCSALEILRITLHSLPADNDPTKSMHAIFSPLLSCCQRLTHVDIMLSGPKSAPQFSFSDDDYLEISQAWQHLQSFSFYLEPRERRYPFPVKPSATLQGSIQPFATYCRDLHSLKLGSTFSWDSNNAMPTQPFARLAILDVSSVLVSDIGIGTHNGLEKPVDELDSRIWGYLVSIANKGTIKLK